MATRLLLMVFAIIASAVCAVNAPGSKAPNELAILDKAVLEVEPNLVARMATRIGKPNSDGLIGRNRRWGMMASARFQYGAGRALRYGASIGDERIMRAAFMAIDAGLASMREDGSFPINLPPQLGHLEPTPADRASAAAFFLSDVCPALLAAGEAAPRRETIMTATLWLKGQTDALSEQDQHAPNRLLLNALAFHSCGMIAASEPLQSEADGFIGTALDFVSEDGVMLEKDGSDTSYQAVSLSAAADLIGLGYDGRHSDVLAQFFEEGTAWLRGQIGPDGKLDSSANTRTCTNEHFLGNYKQVDLWEVFRALSYHRALRQGSSVALRAYSDWLRTMPSPCG